MKEPVGCLLSTQIIEESSHLVWRDWEGHSTVGGKMEAGSNCGRRAKRDRPPPHSLEMGTLQRERLKKLVAERTWSQLNRSETGALQQSSDGLFCILDLTAAEVVLCYYCGEEVSDVPLFTISRSSLS